jgi:hypothetical protein
MTANSQDRKQDVFSEVQIQFELRARVQILQTGNDGLLQGSLLKGDHGL